MHNDSKFLIQNNRNKWEPAPYVEQALLGGVIPIGKAIGNNAILAGMFQVFQWWRDMEQTLFFFFFKLKWGNLLHKGKH